MNASEKHRFKNMFKCLPFLFMFVMYASTVSIQLNKFSIGSHVFSEPISRGIFPDEENRKIKYDEIYHCMLTNVKVV